VYFFLRFKFFSFSTTKLSPVTTNRPAINSPTVPQAHDVERSRERGGGGG